MIQYEFNKEQRTTTATITGCKMEALKHFCKEARITGVEHPERFEMPDEFKVVVKCHPDDEFSEYVGRHIAKHRVLDKWHKSYNRMLWKLEKSIVDNMVNSRIADEAEKKYERVLEKLGLIEN